MSTESVVVLFLALAVAALWRARNHLISRVQRFEESKKAAWISLQSGSGVLPSWIKNEERLSEFLFEAQRLTLHKGVPHRKILEALATEHSFVQLISFAGTLELRNATFAEQQLAVAEAISQRFAYDERMHAEAEAFFSN
jgi:hypothetical protein